ncbi:unnamed protein product, partial [Closterium sp. NIES-54]
MAEAHLSIRVDSRNFRDDNGENQASRQTTAVDLETIECDEAGRSHAESDVAEGSGDALPLISRSTLNPHRRSPPQDTGEASDSTSVNGQANSSTEPTVKCRILCGPSNKVADECSDDDSDDAFGDGDSSSRKQFEKSLSVGSAASGGAGSGEANDGKPNDMEAPIRVRRVDFDISSENHYVIVIHGTFDAPPPGGAPTWYQPPPAGEQNFCRKLSRLLALGPIGQDAVWRDLPCSALPGIPYPFHWDGSNTHAGRVTAAMK